MNKKTKQRIASEKWSDDDIDAAMNAYKRKESESQNDSEESDDAEDDSAEEENQNGTKTLSMKDFDKLIEDRVNKVLKRKKDPPRAEAKKVKGGVILEDHGFIPM